MIFLISYITCWILDGYVVVDLKEFNIYEDSHNLFFIDFYFDKVTAVYLFVGTFITLLIATYSRDYMHREIGFKRFYNTILLFFLGYNFTIIAGNLETLFIGWEILGICSFLLIAFYKNRYLPVKNAIKVFSIYRLGDVGLIMAMWATHHFWHNNITFSILNNYDMVDLKVQSHLLSGIFISLMVVLAATAKSAQLPFSSWLPRAMEGPTPSSAIFYGSLSVHIGIFLLLRMEPFWIHQLGIRILIGLVGLFTSIITGAIARVQSSIKSQIAYASASQIGIIFIEVAAGFDNLALIHFAGNAFLRTYQLLVSPSVVTYLIREQFYNFTPRPLTLEDSLPRKIENTFYILSLKEWNLESLIYRLYWSPLKFLGRQVNFVKVSHVWLVLSPLYILGVYGVHHKELFSPFVLDCLPYFFAFIGLCLVMIAFAETSSALLSWLLVNMNHFWIALAIAFNDNFEFKHVYIYLSGVAVCAIIGMVIIKYLIKQEGELGVGQFYGNSVKYPKLSVLMLLVSLGVTGFPITPTFLGEDLMFGHIHNDQVVLAFFAALSFIIDGLSVIRIYARIFLGPHSKQPYEFGYKSS